MPAKLSSLRITKFRRVRPGSVIDFGPQINAVVGRNGAGKTTLLGLLAALFQNNFSQFVHEEFAIEFRMEDEGFALDAALTNSIRDAARSSLALSGKLVHGQEVVQIESDAHMSSLTLAGQTFTGRAVSPSTDPRFFPPSLIAQVRLALDRPNEPWGGVTPEQILRSHHNSFCTRVTEGAETFLELFARDTDHHKREPELGLTFVKSEGLDRSPMVAHHLPDADVLAQIQTQTDIRDTISLGSELRPLAQFVRLSQYEDARLILLRTSLQHEKPGSRWTFGAPQGLFETANGAQISHDQLSFGEKRLLAFLIKLYANPATIIVDELANGMHHSWLEQCVELLDELGTQAFLSSQNPLLLDCLPLSRETYAKQHALVVCELGEAGEMIWRNLNEAEIEDFFKSLEVGLQHISEIMRSKGLW